MNDPTDVLWVYNTKGQSIKDNYTGNADHGTADVTGAISDGTGTEAHACMENNSNTPDHMSKTCTPYF